MLNENLKKNSKIILLSIFLISTFPLSILSPTSFINIYIGLVSISGIYFLTKNKDYKIFNDYIFKLLFFFWFCLIIVIFFSIDISNSISRTISFARFIILIASIIFFFQYKNYKFANKILIVWTIIFNLITLDLLFEYFYGHNVFGFSSNMDGRLAGVLNQELKIGNYYLGFYLISISTIITIFKNQNKIILFFIILYTITAFFIGERANFIRVLVSLFIFLSIWKGIKIKQFLIILFILIISIFFIFKTNREINIRYNDQVIKLFVDGGISNYLKKSQYGAHYETAYQMFKNYPFTGIGLKNFNVECKKEKYFNPEYLQTKIRCSTHPHQIHLEILSHAGIFTYAAFLLLFIYFIYRGLFYFKKNKNLLHASSVIFVFTMIFLPLPTGSFFTTYSSIIFWINFAIALAFEKKILK
jgi:hypothetical protein